MNDDLMESAVMTDYTQRHIEAHTTGHCLQPHLPTGLDLDEKRRYLIGWLSDLKQRNFAAWKAATVIDIVKDGRIVATFQCCKGEVSIVHC